MPRGLRAIRSRLPRGFFLWAGLSVLLAIGAVHAAITLLPVPKEERARAAAAAQLLTIDATSGLVMGLPKKADADAAPAALPPTPTEATAPAASPPATAEAGAALPANAPRLATQPPATAMPAIAADAESLVAPPAKEITEHSGDFILPKRGDNNESAATLYAKNFTPKKDAKLVSLVLTDAGFNAQTLAVILSLPHGVTVAVSPYAPDGNALIVKLHAAGYETWGMLPVMGSHYPQSDPGPLGLITSLPPEENVRRLQQAMANTLGAVGMVLPVDEALSTHPKLMAPVIDELTTRGLLLLAARVDTSLDALTVKNKALLPSVQRASLVLDANATTAEIQSRLDGLQALLANRQRLIVIIPARPQMLNLVADWLNHNGLGPSVEIAPLSAQYQAAAPETPPAADAKKDDKAAAKPAGDAPPAAAPAAAPAKAEAK